jgi:hypothetical protein
MISFSLNIFFIELILIKILLNLIKNHQIFKFLSLITYSSYVLKVIIS